MEKYIYRFLDKDSNIVYIGKTNNLLKRVKAHFTKGHLQKEQYNKVESIEYMMFISESDQHIAEIYFINKYKPKFNSRDKKKDYLTLLMNIDENWEKMKVDNIRNFLDTDTYPKAKIETEKEEITRLQSEINNLIVNLEIERSITDEDYSKAQKEKEKYEKTILKLNSQIRFLESKLYSIQELATLSTDEQRDTINF